MADIFSGRTDDAFGFIRARGEMTSGLPVVRYTTSEQAWEITAIHEGSGP